jgi:RNA polymerase sigma factor (sigma-70 family)
LNKVLGKLKEEWRVLVDLAYYQGYTHEEIAKTLDLPLGTVKTRIRSALIHLRTLLQ